MYATWVKVVGVHTWDMTDQYRVDGSTDGKFDGPQTS